MAKRGKQEHLLRELLGALLAQYGSQVTWQSLTGMTSINHHQTISDYIDLLQAMDAVFVQHAIIEDKLVAAPKKAKKILFTDPFIYHSVRSWVHPSADPFGDQIQPLLATPEQVGRLVESVVVTHFRRYFPCYYIKAKGEVDLAYVHGKAFHPVEIKWTGQIRPGELKQIAKYRRGLILGKNQRPTAIGRTPVFPLPPALLKLCLEREAFTIELHRGGVS